MTEPIYVARDTGSNELVAPLQKLGLPAEPKTLKYGDIVFAGRGEGGEPLMIAIEYKKLSDAVQSLHTTKRFQGHQLLGLVDPRNGFDRRYLLIEGEFHHDSSGNAVVFRGKGKPKVLPGAPSAVALEEELINITTRGGCPVIQRSTRADALRWVQACYRYWTDKDLDKHKSHLAIYVPDFDNALLTPPSDFRKALTVILPGIGFAASGAVERYVGGEQAGLKVKLLRTLNMTEAQWTALEIPAGRDKVKKFGSKRARQIMEALK